MPIGKFPAPKRVTLFTESGDVELKAGDAVKTGQRLASDLISPATGTITGIAPFKGIDGEDLTSISLNVVEKEEMVAGLEGITEPAKQPRQELVAALSKLGFEADLPDDLDVAVMNALDLDPLNTVNQQTFRENTQLLANALSLLQSLTDAKRIVLVVTRQLQRLAEKNVNGAAEIVVFAPIYPNGLPQVILRDLSGTHPDIQKGFVIGADRLFAMLQALKTGKPLQEKTVTLSVPRMNLHRNIRVRIGTLLADILAQHNIELGSNSKLILDGAMRGAPCYSTDFAVTPATDSICVQDETSVVEYENHPCINCGKCSAVCPVDLRVNLICRYAEYGLFEECRELNADSCIGCGLCAYSCIARRPLIHYIKLAKAQTAKILDAGPYRVPPSGGPEDRLKPELCTEPTPEDKAK